MIGDGICRAAGLQKRRTGRLLAVHDHLRGRSVLKEAHDAIGRLVGAQ